MSRLNETKQAYDKVLQLLDQEIRNRRGSTKDLEKFRETLEVAFYLLGWSQFEYLVREEVKVVVEGRARAHTADGQAWRYLLDNVKDVSVRRRLDVLFHAKPKIRATLDKDYSVRNEAAHNYKKLPPEAKDISLWLDTLETLISNM
ncbi:hypothetical protein PQR05_37430 [Paraburkholderia sediminicola]|uniref:hypothetical protein n=1 Tax=Paraburkholderia sediminicola TaxID=458836 RepID=UPI0038BCBA41